MTTETRGVHVDLHEASPDHPIAFQRRCQVCGRLPSRIRVLEWHPPRGPKGVPAWSVRVTYICLAHRAEAERASQAAESQSA